MGELWRKTVSLVGYLPHLARYIGGKFLFASRDRPSAFAQYFVRADLENQSSGSSRYWIKGGGQGYIKVCLRLFLDYPAHIINLSERHRKKMQSPYKLEKIFCALMDLGNECGPTLAQLDQSEKGENFWRLDDRKFVRHPSDCVYVEREFRHEQLIHAFSKNNIVFEARDIEEFKKFLAGANSHFGWLVESRLKDMSRQIRRGGAYQANSEKWSCVLENYSTKEKVALFCGFVVAETALEVYSSVAQTIVLFRMLKEQVSKNQYNALAYWVLCNRGVNDYTPFGRVIRECSPIEYLLIDDKESRASKHNILMQSLQEEASERKSKKRILAEAHYARAKVNRDNWYNYIIKLKKMSSWERVSILAKGGDFPLHALPTELFPSDSYTLERVSPANLEMLLTTLLRYKNLSKSWCVFRYKIEKYVKIISKKD